MPPAGSTELDPAPVGSAGAPHTLSATRTRAAAMPAEARRAAIVEATVPLLIAQGTEITTRQIAEACCVAEGTIFRVFEDKESLIEAAIDQAFDPAPLEAELRAIDPRGDLGTRCREAVTILQERLASLWRILGALDREPDGRARPDREAPSSPIVDALAALFEPDRARLSISPRDAAHVLRGLTLASSHPAFMGDEQLSPDVIVSVVLDGIYQGEEGRSPC